MASYSATATATVTCKISRFSPTHLAALFSPILMKPENFTWKEVRSEGGTGAASKKHLGTFTERVVLAEVIKVEQGGQFALPHADGLQLAFVYKGEGYVNGEKLMKESAFRLGSGQQATLSSMSSLEALHLVVPAL